MKETGGPTVGISKRATTWMRHAIRAPSVSERVLWRDAGTGVITHSMLCLAANVGAQPTDFGRLLWEELELDGELPLYREDRTKPAHLLGSDVPRCCPLLPATVNSLRRGLELCRAEPDDGQPLASHVFTHIYGGPIDQEQSFTATKYLRRVRKAAD